MTTREAFNHAVKKAFGAITLTTITVAGATSGFDASLFAAEQLFSHISYATSPAGSKAILAGLLVSTVGGGVLGYAFANAALHAAREETKRTKRVYAIARSWARSQKGPNLRSA